MQNKTGFTLVELIVVITILSVLATIGFVSFTGYGVSARDSVRLADIHSIEKSLGIYKLKKSRYPVPEDKVDVTASGITLNYQGYAGKQVLGLIGVHGGGIDPLLGEYYTYATNTSRVKYQLLSYFENSESVKQQAGILNTTYANVEYMYPQLSGDKVGIIVNNTTKQPLQKSGKGFDISQPTSTYEVHMSNEEVITGSNVSLGNIYSKSSCKRLKENDNSLKDGKYMIDPLANGNEFEVLCDMTTDGGGWTLYTGKNIHELPTIGFLEVHPEKLEIKFNQIRWNYRSPLGIELPLIYNIYSLDEAIMLLSGGERIDADAWDNPNLHYSDTQQFSQALSFGEKNTSGVNIDDFRLGVTQNNINYMSSWKNTTINQYYTNMGTSFSWNKSNVSKYLWFPSTPYYSTYRIGDETFDGNISAYAHWTDDRSIAIWIK